MDAQKTIILLIIMSTAALAASPGSYNAQGGNITPINLSLNRDTTHWNGLVGFLILTGTNLSNYTALPGNISLQNITINSPCPTPLTISGYLIFSNSTASPFPLTAGNLTLLEQFLNAGQDNATRTFNTTSTFTIAGNTTVGVPTTYSYVSSAPQNTVFREGYFNDALGNIIFAIEINYATTGYNSSIFDFQALLAQHNATPTTYYVTTQLSVLCPSSGFNPGGGGGGRGGCSTKWVCEIDENCDGQFMRQRCFLNSTCNPLLYPSTIIRCQTKEYPREINETELIEQARARKPLTITNEKIIQATVSRPLTINLTLFNPNPASIDSILLRTHLPFSLEPFTPIHPAPHLYQYAAHLPRASEKRTEWNAQEKLINLIAPFETQNTQLNARTPIMIPKLITAYASATSGEWQVGTTEIIINVSTLPIAITNDQHGDNSDIRITIDNRGKPARDATLELNWNLEKTTQATELIDIAIPANQIALYSETYRTDFSYDHITARANNKHIEVT